MELERKKGAEAEPAPKASASHGEDRAPAAPGDPVSHAVPGGAADPMALLPWIDEQFAAVPGMTAAKKKAPAPDPMAAARKAAVNMQATANAASLIVNRDGVGDRHERWWFLNTLDRVDDPEVRHEMMSKFAQQTGESLQDFIGSADWHGSRDKQQAMLMVSPERDRAAAKLEAMSPEERRKLDAKASGWAQRVLNVTRIHGADDDRSAADIFRAQSRGDRGGFVERSARTRTASTRSTRSSTALSRARPRTKPSRPSAAIRCRRRGRGCGTSTTIPSARRRSCVG